MSAEGQDPLLTRIAESIRAEVDPGFDYVNPGPIPWCAVSAAITETRIALVTTAALHLKGDEPFRTDQEPLGDTSFRVIPADARPGDLDLAASYVDARHIPLDPEVALPLRALAQVHRDGRCGPPAPRHAAFSAGIVRPLPGLEESAASLAEIFREDGAGAVILLPTCPLCVQTVCLLARAFEGRGFPTVCVTLLPDLSRIVGAPRSLAVRFPFGAPCGDPGHGSLHRAVIVEALALLREATEPGTIRASRLAWRREPPAPASLT